MIPFSKPSLNGKEYRAVKKVLKSGWLTAGPVTKEFESRFKDRIGSKHAIAVNSATSGLNLAIEALGIGRGDFVVTTPFTFTSSASCIEHSGATVVFCDIDRYTLCMDPEKLAAILKANKKIKAIVVVHIAGAECNITKIKTICDLYKISTIEDCAHAFPVQSVTGKMVGTNGTIGVYSFYANKTITTGEGGMVVTDDYYIATRIRLMANHGIQNLAWDRYLYSNKWEYDVLEAGYKYNTTDISSAIGICQLKKADELKHKREIIANMYIYDLCNVSVYLPFSGYSDHAWHLFIIQIDNRDRFVNYMISKGIGVGVHYKSLTTMTHYRGRCMVSEDVSKRCVSLPIYPGLNKRKQKYIIKCIKEFLPISTV